MKPLCQVEMFRKIWELYGFSLSYRTVEQPLLILDMGISLDRYDVMVVGVGEGEFCFPVTRYGFYAVNRKASPGS